MQNGLAKMDNEVEETRKKVLRNMPRVRKTEQSERILLKILGKILDSGFRRGI